MVRRLADPSLAPAPVAAGADQAESDGVRGSLTSREWDELVDEVVRRIESRVTAELSRRGRRSTPRVL
jgi:hypothetical protein